MQGVNLVQVSSPLRFSRPLLQFSSGTGWAGFEGGIEVRKQAQHTVTAGDPNPAELLQHSVKDFLIVCLTFRQFWRLHAERNAPGRAVFVMWQRVPQFKACVEDKKIFV